VLDRKVRIMGKRGGSVHLKRLAAPKAMPIKDKKKDTWVAKPLPGPHPLSNCLPLGVLLRDVLNVVETMREAKKILSNRLVLVDGVPRSEAKFPVGLMDVVSLLPEDKHYRIIVDWKGRLQPMPISKEEARLKIAKDKNKTIRKGGKILITLHDGKNLFGDNHIAVADSILLRLPAGRKEKVSMQEHLKFGSGARCYITSGKHVGKIVLLKEILKRGNRKAEAVVNDGKEDFITIADYLMAVGDKFGVKA